MGTHSGIYNKINQIEEIAMATGMIREVVVRFDVEDMVAYMDEINSRSVIVSPKEAAIFTKDDFVDVFVVIAEKIVGGNSDDVLKSFDSGMSILRVLASELNGSYDENVILQNVIMDVYNPVDADWVVSTLTCTLDMAMDIVQGLTSDTGDGGINPDDGSGSVDLGGGDVGDEEVGLGL